MPAILFGSISTIADTSELQREAFNDAFRTHGLDWHWDRDVYREELRGNGGQQRIADYARTRGRTDVDAAAVHRTKSEVFQRRLAAGPVPVRAGVAETITMARRQGYRVGLVTTTSPENVTALLDSVGSQLDIGDFDIILDSSHVSDPKPDPAVYHWALEQLGEPSAAALAIEDNLGGVASAKAAGLTTIAFPNENTIDHDFGQADLQVEKLDAQTVTRILTGAVR